jgi:hypothetical protein
VTDELAAYKLAGEPFPGISAFLQGQQADQEREGSRDQQILPEQGYRPERLADSPEEFRPDEIISPFHRYDLRAPAMPWVDHSRQFKTPGPFFLQD